MTPSLFFIYDSKDAKYLSEIEKQLQVLVNNKTLNYWHEGLLTPGVEWRKVRDEKLRSADIALPIVSANFLASDNCTGLLEDADKQGKQIVPIIASHCLWDMNDILAKQSPIPKKPNDTEATPISDWKELTKAYAAIVRAIRELRDSWQISEQQSESEKLPISDLPPTNTNTINTTGNDNIVIQDSNNNTININTHPQNTPQTNEHNMPNITAIEKALNQADYPTVIELLDEYFGQNPTPQYSTLKQTIEHSLTQGLMPPPATLQGLRMLINNLKKQ